MSLCILLRAPNGRAMMAADTALSAEISNITYRLSDAEDYCKAFEHNGSLIFCSGLYAVCRQIRAHIGAMETIDAASIQEYARQTIPSDTTSDSDDVVILICRPDGEIITMRAKDDFAIETQPPVGDGAIAITTIGAHSESAYENAIGMAQETECGLPLITKVFTSVLDEEVGAHLVVLERVADGAVQRTHGEFIEPAEIRKIVMSELAHCVIHATDGVFNGTVYAKDGEFSGTLKAAVIDGKLTGSANGGEISGVSLNIGNGNFVVDNAGNATLAGNINMSGGNITWGNNIPNKQRFAASTSGPWHDTMQSGDIYCCTWNYATETWNPPYKMVGTDGRPGSDANVNYNNVKSALNRASKAAMTIIDGTSVDTVDIHANNIYGGNIYAGEGSDSFVTMNEDGLYIYSDGSNDPKAQILSVNNGNSVVILLGDGEGPSGIADQFLIRKNQGETIMTYSGDGANTCGFTFRDGNIYVNGQLIGGNVTAVFG